MIVLRGPDRLEADIMEQRRQVRVRVQSIMDDYAGLQVVWAEAKEQVEEQPLKRLSNLAAVVMSNTKVDAEYPGAEHISAGRLESVLRDLGAQAIHWQDTEAGMPGDRCTDPQPRLHLSKLPMVLNNFRAQLPASWPIHLFHEPDAPLPSWSTLPALRDALRESTLRLHALPATAKEMPRSRVFNRLEAGLPTQWRSPRHAPAATSWYNYWLTDPAFWANPSFEHPWLLLFEADTALCAHPSTPASAFLEGSAAYGSPAAYVGKRARAAPPPLAKLHQRQGMSPP